METSLEKFDPSKLMDGNKQVIHEHLNKLLIENAPAMFASLMSNGMQQVLQDIYNRLGARY